MSSTLASLRPTGRLLLALGLCLSSGWLSAQDLPVQTAALRDVAVYPWREVPAETRARNVTNVAAQVGGTLLNWSADVGLRVQQGQVLAQIDPTDFKLARDQAQAQVNNVQAQLDLAQRQQQRARDLAGQGFFSQEALSQNNTQVTVWRTQLQSAQVQLRLAQRQLDKTTVRAPFEAEVTARMAQSGASVGAGTPLFTLSESRGVQLHADLSTAQARELRQARTINWQSGTQTITLQAKPLQIAGAITPSTRTRALRASLPDGVTAGNSGVLRWQTSQAHIPAELLVRRGGRLGVFVVREQRAHFQALTAAQEGQAAAVDLPAETLLVTQGQQRLQDGDALSAAETKR